MSASANYMSLYTIVYLNVNCLNPRFAAFCRKHIVIIWKKFALPPQCLACVSTSHECAVKGHRAPLEVAPLQRHVTITPYIRQISLFRSNLGILATCLNFRSTDYRFPAYPARFDATCKKWSAPQ